MSATSFNSKGYGAHIFCMPDAQPPAYDPEQFSSFSVSITLAYGDFIANPGLYLAAYTRGYIVLFGCPAPAVMLDALNQVNQLQNAKYFYPTDELAELAAIFFVNESLASPAYIGVYDPVGAEAPGLTGPLPR